MPDSHIPPLHSFALVVSGTMIAAFWASTYPFDGFAGADVAHHPLFTLGQILHLAGAIFGTVGYFGLYQALRPKAGWMAFPASFIAIAGMVLFAADGALALVVFPALASFAPELLGPEGPMFTGRALVFYITVYATHMTGIILLAGLMFIYSRISVIGLFAFLIGGVVMNLPPTPGLHWMAMAGGIAFGSGCVVLGSAYLRKGA